MRFSLLIGACVLASGCAARRIERAETSVVRSEAYVEGWEDATRFFLETEYEGQQKRLDAIRSGLEVLENKLRDHEHEITFGLEGPGIMEELDGPNE